MLPRDGLFDPSWYRWQHPLIGRTDPWAHYLSVGVHRGFDPSPFIDLRRCHEFTGRRSYERTFLDLLDGFGDRRTGRYWNFHDLTAAQSDFYDRLSPYVLRTTRQKRRYLLWIQCAGSSASNRLSSNPRRSFDILANHFTPEGVGEDQSDILVFQTGTKFTAVWQLWKEAKGLFDDYEYVMLLDGDIDVSQKAIEHGFDALERISGSLGQLPLMSGSYCIWPDLVGDPGKPVRINTAEIMMPIVSMDFFRDTIEVFSRSVSGFGIDLFWGSALSKQNETAWLLGGQHAIHPRPIDPNGGAYYEMLRSQSINPKCELWLLANAQVRDIDIKRIEGAT